MARTVGIEIDGKVLKFDDTKKLSEQPKWFQTLINKVVENGIAVVGNVTFVVYDTGRILSNNIEEGGEDGI
jgi:hypothetical protein